MIKFWFFVPSSPLDIWIGNVLYVIISRRLATAHSIFTEQCTYKQFCFTRVGYFEIVCIFLSSCLFVFFFFGGKFWWQSIVVAIFLFSFTHITCTFCIFIIRDFHFILCYFSQFISFSNFFLRKASKNLIEIIN